MYEEIEHTADYALRVWGADLPELFLEAARGMNALTGGRAADLSITRELSLQAPDLETLLVNWLEELAFLIEIEGEIFQNFQVQAFAPTSLQVQLTGGKVQNLEKLIKAVTFHGLAIQNTAAGYQAVIVFDV